MANPTYGTDYDATYPTPSVVGYDEYGAGTIVGVPTAGATFRFALTAAVSRDVRIAYQVRYRESANAVGWDGGVTWTDWQDSNGVVDAWEELYSGTGHTALDNGPGWGVPGGVTTWNLSIPWNTVDTYDAIEFRVQAWCFWHKSGHGYYGSPDTKVIRVDFMPTFTATAVASGADSSLAVALTVDDWGRGSQSYRIASLAFSDGGSVTTAKTSTSGAFTYGASEVGDYIDSVSVTIDGTVTAVGSYSSASYAVTQSITVDNPSSAVTAPVVAITDSNGAKEFKVTDASYESVTVTVSWGGGSYVLEAAKSGGYWYADVVVPFNVTVSWTVAGYRTIGGVLLYNTDDGTLSETGLRYELRADDGSTLTMTLEAKEQMTWDVDSATITLASGRTVARHGLGNKRTWTLRGQLLGSSHSATSDWIDALAILNLPQNLTYRNPYGEVARVCVTSWTRNPASIWDVLDISVSFTEVE